MLANEQVIDGHCERCGAAVEAKTLEQWFFKITDYADRLLDDMETLESWPERVLTMQRNWIGRSQGAEVMFRAARSGRRHPGLHDAARHAVRRHLLRAGARAPAGAPTWCAAPTARTRCWRTCAAPPVRRWPTAWTRARPRRASFTGRHVINPVNGEPIEVWVADYVLVEYGTGAVMAVPAHDERDFAFAQTFGLPIRQVVAPAGGDHDIADRGLHAAHGRRAPGQLRPVRRPAAPTSRWSASSTGWRSTAAASAPPPTGCATGWSRASATGARRSRSSTARRAAWSPCPRPTCRCCCPR